MGSCLDRNARKVGAVLSELVLDMLDFTFPRTCVVCGDLLIRQEFDLCFSCYVNLPFSVYGLSKTNPICRGWLAEYP